MNTKIRLQTSFLLNSRFKLNDDNLEEKANAVREKWQPQAESILNGLEEVTGLTFLKSHIDVFLINPDGSPSISFPAIVKIFDDTDKTICVIVHELIHNLMWDNEQKDNWSAKIRELYPQENKKTAIHIAVHAILEAVYVDVLNKPEDIAKDIEDSQTKPDYKRAWEVVKEEGHKNIIAKLKK